MATNNTTTSNADTNNTHEHETLTAVKKKLWDTIMNPHLYKIYTKVIDKALWVLPSKQFDAHEVFPGLYVGDVSNLSSFSLLLSSLSVLLIFIHTLNINDLSRYGQRII
jgi:hypothetical protein